MMKITEISATGKESAKKRLAAYCRVSTNSEDQKNSFLAQIKYYRDYVKTHNQYELADIYADDGITGTEYKNRNEFNRMLSDCKKRKIDCIITKSISRFARNTNDLLTVIRMLKELGIKVIFEEQGIDTDKINSEMIVAFPGLAAQQESQNISDNVRWSNKKRMESGTFKPTAVPFGFKKKNGGLVVDEEEAVVINEIFNLYINGCGKQNIANIINEKYSSIQIEGASWTRSKINFILNNEKYMGDSILQKKYTNKTFPKKQLINRGEVQKYYVENYCPAIVSKEVFERAKELQKTRGNTPVMKANHIFSGIIRCSDCNSLFRKIYSNEMPYWICSGRASSEMGCKTNMIRENDLILTFTAVMYKLKCNKGKVIEPLIANIKTLHSRINPNQNEIESINKKIAEYSAKMHMIAKLHTRGVLTDSEYIAQTSKINKTISKLRTDHKNLVGEDKYVKIITELEKLIDYLDKYEYDIELTRETITAIMKEVSIDENNKLKFKFIGNLIIEELLLKEYGDVV